VNKVAHFTMSHETPANIVSGSTFASPDDMRHLAVGTKGVIVTFPAEVPMDKETAEKIKASIMAAFGLPSVIIWGGTVTLVSESLADTPTVINK